MLAVLCITDVKQKLPYNIMVFKYKIKINMISNYVLQNVTYNYEG